LMLPTIKEVVKIVSGFVERLNKMDEGTKRAIITVGTIVAALGPLLFIGGKILTAIPLLVAGIKAVGVALMFLNANPIALIILGVAALATGIYLLIKNWDEVSAFLISAGKKVLEWFKENWDKILIILTGPLGLAVVLIIKHWDEIKAAFQAAYDFIVKIVTRIKEELTQRLAAVVEPVKQVAEGIKGAFSWLKDQLVGNSVIPDMVDSILEHMDRLRKGLDVSYEVERLARTAADALEPFTDAIGLMATDAAAGWEAFKNAARDAIASVLRMLAEKAFAQAIAQIPGLPFTAGAMAAWTAAGIAALAAAGVVKGLASGGIVTKPTLAMVGERGPEAVIPLGRGGGMGTVNVYVQGSLMEEEGLVRRITEVQKRYARGY